MLGPAHRRRPARAPAARPPRGARGRRAVRRARRATVVVEVRGIASRPVRRRGMRPLVEATVARRDRADEGDLLQPAVARPALPAGHAAACCTASIEAPQPLPRPGPRPDHRGRRPEARRSPTTRPPRGSPRPRSSRSCASTPARSATCSSRCRRALRVRERLPDRRARAARRALPGRATDDQELGRRRLAFDELLLVQLALLRRRRSRRDDAPGAGARRRARADRALARDDAPVRAHRRPGARARGDRRRPRAARGRCSGC